MRYGVFARKKNEKSCGQRRRNLCHTRTKRGGVGGDIPKKRALHRDISETWRGHFPSKPVTETETEDETWERIVVTIKVSGRRAATSKKCSGLVRAGDMTEAGRRRETRRQEAGIGDNVRLARSEDDADDAEGTSRACGGTS